MSAAVGDNEISLTADLGEEDEWSDEESSSGSVSDLISDGSDDSQYEWHVDPSSTAKSDYLHGQTDPLYGGGELPSVRRMRNVIASLERRAVEQQAHQNRAKERRERSAANRRAPANATGSRAKTTKRENVAVPATSATPPVQPDVGTSSANEVRQSAVAAPRAETNMGPTARRSSNNRRGGANTAPRESGPAPASLHASAATASKPARKKAPA